MLFSAKVVALPGEEQYTILNDPASSSLPVGLLLCLGQLLLTHLCPLDRIGHQSFPSRQVLAVEEGEVSTFDRILRQVFLDGLSLVNGIRIIECLTHLLQDACCFFPCIIGVVQCDGHRCLGGSLAQLRVIHIGNHEAHCLIYSCLPQ